MESYISLAWIGLAIALFFGCFGLEIGFYLILFTIFTIIGFILLIFYMAMIRSNRWIDEETSRHLVPPRLCHPKIFELIVGSQHIEPDRKMTGSSIIDAELTEVLNFIIRDFVNSWYSGISHNDTFSNDVKHSIQSVIASFSARARSIDLVPYITTRLVDDFASHVRLYRRALDRFKEYRRDITKEDCQLVDLFFELEAEMEHKITRGQICASIESECLYLQDISEAILFLVLPPEDFHNKLLRYIVREIMVNSVLLKTISMVADPDFINQLLAQSCPDTTFNSESFLTVIKTSDNVEELKAIQCKVDLDISRYRSRDTGGTQDGFIKQQLSSLQYVRGLCQTRIIRLQTGEEEADFASIWDPTRVSPGVKVAQLTLENILCNNVAVSHFIEFMSSINAQDYIYFYLNVQGYRASAEQQISEAVLRADGSEKIELEMVRDSARSMFNQYFSEKASYKIQLDSALVERLDRCISEEEPNDRIFDEVQHEVWKMMNESPGYYKMFKNSPLYIKLLAELRLLRDSNDVDVEEECIPGNLKGSTTFFTLRAAVTSYGICKEMGKEYAVYMIHVVKESSDGTSDIWDTFRRYRDFHEFHSIVVDKYGHIPGLTLPSKKTFNNTSKLNIEQRQHGLNSYLQVLLCDQLHEEYPGLFEASCAFLEPVSWDSASQLGKLRLENLFSPLKYQVDKIGSSFKNMPDVMAEAGARISITMKSIPNDLNKVFQKSGLQTEGFSGAKTDDIHESAKVGASLENEEEPENIPLRILLLLLDEIFDLKQRNLWLRRRIIGMLKEILKTLMGDAINRKIIEAVESLTQADQIADYIKNFKDSFWPDGILAADPPVRDRNTQLRTRVVCKTKILGTLSAELHSLLGAETTRAGSLRIFSMFQYPELNKRLIYVIFEGILQNVFPQNKFEEVFKKIHTLPKASDTEREKLERKERRERRREKRQLKMDRASQKLNH